MCIFDQINLSFLTLLLYRLLLHFVCRWRCCKKRSARKIPWEAAPTNHMHPLPACIGLACKQRHHGFLGGLSWFQRFNLFLTFVEFSGIFKSIWLSWITVSLLSCCYLTATVVALLAIVWFSNKKGREGQISICVKLLAEACCLAGFFEWNGLPGSKRKIFSKRGSALPWHTRSVRSLAPPRAPSNRKEGDQELN